jgi:hypothetical protein
MSPAPATTAIPLSYKAFTAFVTLACVVLCALLLRANALNRRLREDYSQALEKAGSAGIAVGESVEPLRVAAVQGDPSPADASTLLTHDDGRAGTLLLLVSGGCDTCRFSLPYFSRLADLASKQGFVPLAVQLDAAGDADLKFDGSMGFPIVAVEHSEKTWLRRVPLVPAILLVDPRGAVVKTYFGELSPKQQDDLEGSLQGSTAPKENAP